MLRVLPLPFGYSSCYSVYVTVNRCPCALADYGALHGAGARGRGRAQLDTELFFVPRPGGDLSREVNEWHMAHGARPPFARASAFGAAGFCSVVGYWYTMLSCVRSLLRDPS